SNRFVPISSQERRVVSQAGVVALAVLIFVTCVSQTPLRARQLQVNQTIRLTAPRIRLPKLLWQCGNVVTDNRVIAVAAPLGDVPRCPILCPEKLKVIRITDGNLCAPTDIPGA